MFNTLQHLHALTRAYEQGQITEQELLKEWVELLEMLYLRLMEATFFLFEKRSQKA